MREIKFRAWFELENKMVESENLALSYEGEDLFDFAFDKELVLPDGNIKGTLCFKLMQYTGLKDKNGREIYEGDIVEYTKTVYADCSRTEIEDIEESVIGEVYYAEGLWIGFRFIDGTGKLFLPGQVSSEDNNPEIEVIGNIYENPKLLEGDSK